MMKKYSKKGFTLIETLVAISVFLFAITGPMVLINDSVTVSRRAKAQSTALYLAQEGVDMVRAVRDSNMMNGNGLFSGIDACEVVGQGGCELDMNLNGQVGVVGSCVLDTGCTTLLNYSNGRFSYGSGDSTNFSRIIQVQSVGVTGDEYEVTGTTRWTDEYGSAEVSVVTTLFDWK